MSATLEQLDKIPSDKRGHRYYYYPCNNKDVSMYITNKHCWLRYYCNKHKKGIKLSEQDIFYLRIK